MTDNDIIKALECLKGEKSLCNSCPYGARYPDCEKYAIRDIHDLINRQKAEIERLTADLKTTENIIKNNFLQKAGFDIDPLAEFKSEAVKEFAERLKADIVETGDEHGLGNRYPVLTYNYIDNLVKEMVGAESGSIL